ncbi:thrombospondin type 1 domain protein, partial [Ostertagia ostertagi]
ISVYASVWGGWSAWSFCSNGVRIRVRACNTVRGFSCLGPNQERRIKSGQKECGHVIHKSFRRTRRATVPSDYDVVDPYEADRREAMKQLYPDDAASSESSPNISTRTRQTQSQQEPIELDRALKELLGEKPTTPESALAHRLSSEQLQFQQEELDAAKKEGNETLTSVSQDITDPDFFLEDSSEEPIRIDLNQEAPPPPTTPMTFEPEIIKELLEDEDHFDRFGTRPEVVQPKLSNTIDDDPEPDVVTPVQPNRQSLSVPTTTFHQP